MRSIRSDATAILASLALLADDLDADEAATIGTSFVAEARRKEIAETRAALRTVGRYASLVAERTEDA